VIFERYQKGVSKTRVFGTAQAQDKTWFQIMSVEGDGLQAGVEGCRLSCKSTIIRLIDELAQGERMIFDDLGETFNTLGNFSNRLDNIQYVSEEQTIREELLSEIQALK
jgi:hypothetical protein